MSNEHMLHDNTRGDAGSDTWGPDNPEMPLSPISPGSPRDPCNNVSMITNINEFIFKLLIEISTIFIC